MTIKGKLKLQFTKKPKKKLPKLPDRIKFTNRKGKTFILITHRVPLLRLVDRLVVMDSARLVADGPKEQIMEMLNKSQVRSAK